MIDKIGDPILNNVALGLLIFIVVMLFYGIIAVHDIPHKIAEKRDHPHQDAIHAAGWVSLFTLHVLWPFLWIWAMAYRPDRGWGFSQTKPETGQSEHPHELEPLRARLEQLGSKVELLEGRLAREDNLSKIEPAAHGEPATPEVKRLVNIERETN